MKDIENRKDIELLINSFYELVIKDDQIGHFFNQVVDLDWDKHFPIMYDFWETTLLGSGGYSGNPMLKHIALNDKKRLEPKHFERWLELWKSTIVENFSGNTADKAIARASQIAGLMEYKVGQMTVDRP